MKRFEFRLQSVYDLRRHSEKEGRDALSRERQALVSLEEKGRLLQADYRHWSETYLKTASRGVRPSEMLLINSYLSDLTLHIRQNDGHIASQAELVEKARLALIEKMKDRKAMDILYDKQYRTYLHEQQLASEKEIDEFVLARMFAK